MQNSAEPQSFANDPASVRAPCGVGGATRAVPPRPRSAGASRRLLALAWPVAVASLGQTAMGLVDVKLVGGLGAAALAGVSVGNALIVLALAMASGLGRGVKVQVAFAQGASGGAGSAAQARAALLLGLAAGALLAIVLFPAASLLPALGVAADVAGPARAFVQVRALGIMAACGAIALGQYRQGLGDTRTSMVAALVANAVNAALAYTLIHGRFGLPALGIRGAGLATSLAEVAQLVFISAVAFRRSGRSRGGASTRAAMREMARSGLPFAAQFGAEIIAYTLAMTVIGSFGAVSVAAHHLVLQTLTAAFLPGVALAEGTSVLVAQALGRGDREAAERALRTGLTWAVAVLTGVGLVLYALRARLAFAFTADAGVAATAMQLLLYGALIQPLDAANLVFRAGLRGAGAARRSALSGALVVWLCVPGGTWLFGRWLGWGIHGAWAGLVAEALVGSAVMACLWLTLPGKPASAGDAEEGPALSMAIPANGGR